MLTQKRLMELVSYEKETGVFLRNGAPWGSHNGNGYLRGRLDGKIYYLHNLAWLYVYGHFPTRRVDHRDLHRSNNAIGNLREATKSQNQANTRARVDSATKLKGAFPHSDGKNFYSKIRVDGRQIYLGYFATAEQAHAAYVAASLEYFGEFARAA